MVRLDDILDKVIQYHPQANLELLKKAYVYSAKVHKGQTRASGEPYLIHPIEVASILADLRLDEAAVATGFLHDTVEDTLATLEEIEQLFGTEVATLVDGVTKLSKISFANKEDRAAENFRKMVVAMAKDIRVILIKLADRLHNMRTMDYMAEHKRERIAQETAEIYAPLANRLGIHWVKSELEDLSFRYIKPKEHDELKARVELAAKQRQTFIDDVRKTLQEKMRESEIPALVTGRVKHLFSIYKKMKQNNIDIDQIYDILAFRLLVDNVGQCYEAVGIVHSLWPPIPGRFKDYIAMPKPNMYQSLHTSVVGPGGERVEIQIRTHDMHAIAEQGVAAHWEYKEGGKVEKAGPKMKKSDAQQFGWLRQLMEWQKDVADPTEFIDTVKVDLFADEVFVFTPKGKVVSLSRGSCPIDFAFAIHSEVGMHCSGARVNGRIVPLRYKLKNGDMVEVITSPSQWPSKDWLSIVATGRAKNRIRAYIRIEERRRSEELGRELIDKELRRYGGNLKKFLGSKEMAVALTESRVANEEELFIQVGYGKLLPGQVTEHLIAKEDRPAEKNPSLIGDLFRKVTRRASPTGVVVNGVDDMLVRFAKCCAPLPGDRIVGFVTRGRGITVHAFTCPRAIDMDPERRIECIWDKETKFTRPVSIRVLSADKPGMLATLSQAFTQMGINISQANCKVIGDDRAVNTFEVSVSDSDQLRTLVHAIEKISGVLTVERV
jgi:guanosine-3',5'-bis(diphosphate) 3'-pyrophosphohydrolase